jgi:hypothetical protein
MTATATSFPLSKHTGGCDTAPAFSGLRVYLQFTWEVGLPLSPVVFFPSLLLQAFPLLIAGHVLLFLPAGMFVYSWVGSGSSPLSCGVFLPLPLSEAFLLRVPHCLWFVSLFLLLLITQFLFFPRVGVGLSRGLCWSGPGLSMGVPCTT